MKTTWRLRQVPEQVHDWVKTESLVASAGVPYEVEQVACRDCGAVWEQDRKRLVA